MSRENKTAIRVATWAGLGLLLGGCCLPCDSAPGEAEVEAIAPPAAETDDVPEWAQGGTLHDATVAEWRAGTPEDQLATAGDWVSASMLRREYVPSGFDEIRVQAIELRTCIDAAVEGGELDHQDVASSATVCLVLLEAEE